MQTATTLQFRKAVRKVAAKRGLRIANSYTNSSPWNDSPYRTVGFLINDATPAIAAKIEKKLNKKGLTAETRCTSSTRSIPSGIVLTNGYTYIRGTCFIVS